MFFLVVFFTSLPLGYQAFEFSSLCCLGHSPVTPGMTNSTLAISSPELGEGSLSSSFFGCFIKLFLSEGNEDFPNPLARGKTAESWVRRASSGGCREQGRGWHWTEAEALCFWLALP